MDGFRFCFFLGFFITTHLIGVTIAEDDFWYSFCSRNYTASNPFRRNLDDVLYSITKTNNGYGFFNLSAGEGINKVNAVALCRGDINESVCERCVDDATRKLREICPYQMEATGWYDYCHLVFSNTLLVHSTAIDEHQNYCFSNLDDLDSDWTQFNRSVGNLFDQLRNKASKGGMLRKYASGNLSVHDSLTINGLVQCTPDLSELQCNQCLADATDELQFFSSGKTGGRTYKPSCSARYEVYRFFNETWVPGIPLPPSPLLETKRKHIKGLFIGIVSAAGALMAISCFLISKAHYLKLKLKGVDRYDGKKLGIDAPSCIYIDKSKFSGYNIDKLETHHFNLRTIRDATNDFALQNKIGEGGFGPVYRGKLDDGTEIAVKRLSKNSSQGLEEFKTEVRLIVELQHKNLVRLLGCCIKGEERLLIYEYMANTSLDSCLFDPSKSKDLNWDKRANIVWGIAKGLRYLHEDSRLKIVHRDMKTSNVLLDDAMDPKISDFGTARIFGVNQIVANTNIVVGTHGYIAPEYAMEGLFSTKSDVYSFGVLLLETIHGQRNNGFFFQKHEETLLSYAWRTWKEGNGQDLIDKNLIKNCPLIKALKWIHIALLCVQQDPKDRPTMSEVIFMLEDQWSTFPEPLEPPLSFTKPLVFDESSTTISRTRYSSSSHSLEAVETRYS